MKPKQLKALREKSKRLSVRLIRPKWRGDPFMAIVGSSSNAVFNHFVTVQFQRDGMIQARCTCPWAEHGGVACCHVIGTLSKLAEEKHSVLSFWSSYQDAVRQKRSVFHLVGNMTDEAIWITSRHIS